MWKKDKVQVFESLLYQTLEYTSRRVQFARILAGSNRAVYFNFRLIIKVFPVGFLSKIYSTDKQGDCNTETHINNIQV